MKRRIRATRWAVAAAGPAILVVAASAAAPRSAGTEHLDGSSSIAGRSGGQDTLGGRIRAALGAGDRLVVGQRLRSAYEARAFYEARSYTPAWLDGGRPSAAASELAEAIRGAAGLGLRPADYHEAAISARLERTGPGDVELELLLTDAWLTLATHLARGRIEPRRLHSGWTLPRPSIDAPGSLRSALDRGIAATLDAIDVDEAGARARMRAALARYRRLAEQPWPVVPVGPTLRRGDHDARVIAIRKRIGAETGAAASGSAAFDEALDADVRSFQRRHGLADDGIVGRRTLAALNVPALERQTQIALNLERLRWVPADSLRGTRIEVNIADFSMRVLEGGRPILSMKAVAGTPDWPTPVMSTRMTALVLNPFWNVPERITALEILPAVRRDPQYLARNELEVVSGFGPGARVLDPAGLDWSVRPYLFRQRPGPTNPLGRVKFLLDNAYDVHLHDTPSRAAFGSPDRALSHGCVRLERALDLAEWVLGTDRGLARDSLDSAVATGRETTMSIRSRPRVDLFYFTAWVDDDGSVQFRDDLYGHDRRLMKVLSRTAGADAQPPPGCGG